jgi:hypothetical protein
LRLRSQVASSPAQPGRVDCRLVELFKMESGQENQPFHAISLRSSKGAIARENGTAT